MLSLTLSVASRHRILCIDMAFKSVNTGISSQSLMAFRTFHPSLAYLRVVAVCEPSDCRVNLSRLGRAFDRES